MSQDIKNQFDGDIEDKLINNKDCKILQCHLNNYTDCLKISFVVSTYSKIAYRINIFQTRPNVRKTISGQCEHNKFDDFIQDTITKFNQSVNKNKVCDDWETTFVSADNLANRHSIKTWEGETHDNFVDIIDDITQVVVNNVK